MLAVPAAVPLVPVQLAWQVVVTAPLAAVPPRVGAAFARVLVAALRDVARSAAHVPRSVDASPAGVAPRVRRGVVCWRSLAAGARRR